MMCVATLRDGAARLLRVRLGGAELLREVRQLVVTTARSWPMIGYISLAATLPPSFIAAWPCQSFSTAGQPRRGHTRPVPATGRASRDAKEHLFSHYFLLMFQNTVTGVSSTPSMLLRSANG